MRTRLAISVVLLLGLVLTASGGALAVTGPSAQKHAGHAQYGDDDDDDDDDDGGKEEEELQALIQLSSSVSGPTSGPPPRGAPPVPSERGLPGEAGAAPGAQAEVLGEGRIPFTGYLAIPVMLLGIALLALGVVMRRRLTRRMAFEERTLGG